jgi:PKD repeat protein
VTPPLPGYPYWTTAVLAPNGLDPPNETGAAVTYDVAQQELLIFGGANGSGAASDQTWTFAAGDWNNLTASLPTSPGAEIGAALAYDPALGGDVLFGGWNGDAFSNATWFFNGTGWHRMAELDAPSPRMNLSLAYDPTEGFLVGFGGTIEVDHVWSTYDDTWVLNGTQWQELTLVPGRSAPGAGEWSAAAWDGSDSEIVLVGGDPSGPPCTAQPIETWSFAGGSWTNRTATAGAPPILAGASAMAWDPALDAVILFGGQTFQPNCRTPTNDTWVFHLGNWANLTASIAERSPTPPARCCGGAAFDAATRSLALWGGNASLVGNTTVELSNLSMLNGSGDVAIATNRSVIDLDTPTNFTSVELNLPGPVTRNWSFGDGAYANRSADEVRHAYARTGNFTVQLTVTDGNGTVWYDALNLTVVPRLKIAPSVSLGPLDAPAEISFDAHDSGGVWPLVGSWSFSDGFLDPYFSGSHLLATPGNYTIRLHIRDQDGEEVFYNTSVLVEPTLVATVNLTPVVGIVPFQVVGHASLYGGGAPRTGSWWFGVGPNSTVDSANASFTYRTKGVYRAEFVGADGSQGKLFENFTVQAVNPPVTTANATSNLGVAPLSVQLFANTTGGGGEDSFTWSFGDGSPNGTGFSVLHTFEAPGSYTVQVRSVTRFGYASNATELVRVVAPLSAELKAESDGAAVPYWAHLNLTTLGGLDGIGAVSWSFGDGLTASGGENISHHYNQSGNYTVRAVVHDGFGDSAAANLTLVLVDPLAAYLIVSADTGGPHGEVHVQAFARLGLPPYAYAWSGLPVGCVPGNVSFASCTPDSSGTFAVVVEVFDAIGEHVNATANLEVNATPSSSTPTNEIRLAELALGASVLVAAVVVVLLLRKRSSPP